MKKILVAAIVLTISMGCNDNAGESNNHDSTGTEGVTDTTHPANGTVNSSAISTDTAAMNTGKAMEKKDSAEKK